MRVSYSDLEGAFTSGSDELQYWLDKQTGEVILISEDMEDWATDDDDTDEVPEWAREGVEQARRVLRAIGELETAEETEDSERYVSIPTIDSHEGYRTMEEFVETVKNPRLQGSLVQALRGGKPFRRFKAALLEYPAQREEWFAFENQRVRETIKEWAEAEGIELDFTQA